jgi:3-oxoacyl-[acyl-carrier protein] reductase
VLPREAMETGLANKVAVITGGAGAIGAACARALMAEGATVAVADRDAAGVARLVEELRAAGGDALGVTVDTTREEEVTRLVEEVHRRTGRLDVLVNCVGIFQATPVDELSLVDWDQMLGVNLTGVFLLCRTAARVMRAQGQGRIINLGSLAGQVGGLAAGANYAVSKAGVICLTKALARALGGAGITVNTINPGPVESPMVEAWPPGRKEEQLARIPLGRLGRPEDIANAVVFLASEGASYIHGAHLDINGGLHMD